MSPSQLPAAATHRQVRDEGVAPERCDTIAVILDLSPWSNNKSKIIARRVSRPASSHEPARVLAKLGTYVLRDAGGRAGGWDLSNLVRALRLAWAWGVMTTTYAIQEMFRRAVVRATLAPSIHNTQPWRFVLRPGELDVYADRDRQLAVLDPTGRQLHLSVGCAVFNAQVSLAASGASPVVRRLPDPTQPSLLASIDIGDEPVDRELAALDPVIGLRQTNRRRFASGEVPPDVVDTLVAAAEHEGVILYPVEQEDDRMALARLVQRADSHEISDPAYRAELRAWTTIDPARRDGVRALVVPHVDGTAGDEVPIRDFDSQGAGALPAETRSGREQCLLVLGTSTDRPEAWLRAGEALERVWLEATRVGYVASLFSQPVEVAAVRAQLRSELRLTMHPHMVIRVGRAPVTPASRRRHVAEVLDDRTAG